MPAPTSLGFVVVLAPLVIAFDLAVAGVILYIMLHHMSAWLTPQYVAQNRKRRSLWNRAVDWTKGKAAAAINYVLTTTRGILGGHAFAALKPVTGFFNAMALLIGRLAVHETFSANNVRAALQYLRKVGIPKLIEAAVQPVRANAQKALNIATIVNTELVQARVGIAQALSGISIAVNGDFSQTLTKQAVVIRNMWDDLYQDVVPKLNKAVNVTLPQIGTRVKTIEDDLYGVYVGGLEWIRGKIKLLDYAVNEVLLPRLEKLEALLAPAALAALILATMKAAAPNLFCRNVTDATKAVCKVNENDWADVMNALAIGLILGGLVELTKELQAVTGVVAGGVKELAEV